MRGLTFTEKWQLDLLASSERMQPLCSSSFLGLPDDIFACIHRQADRDKGKPLDASPQADLTPSASMLLTWQQLHRITDQVLRECIMMRNIDEAVFRFMNPPACIECGQLIMT